MVDGRLIVEGKSLEINGKISYTRQVGDLGDISTSSTNYTNSLSIIRDNISIRSFKGLSLSGSRSRDPYVKLNGQLLIDEIPISDNNAWISILSTNNSNFRVSILDGNIDFWKAIEGLSLGDIDLSEANFSKTWQAIQDSWLSDYAKYIVGKYADEGGEPWDIRIMNPAISEKYILDQIFNHIGMDYGMTPNIDSWLVIPQDTEEEATAPVVLVELEADETVPYTDGYFPQYQNIVVNPDASFHQPTGVIIVDKQGYYRYRFDSNMMKVSIIAKDASGYTVVMPDFNIDFYLTLDGERINTEQKYRADTNSIFKLVFAPPTNADLESMGYEGYTIVKYEDAEIVNFEFEFERVDDTVFTFSDSIGKIKAKDFIKYLMHRYSLTLFYKNRICNFLTIDERLSAETTDLNPYLIEKVEETYTYLDYAQKNYLKHKYAEEGEDFNNGILSIDNDNISEEKILLESFTYSQDENDFMEMWEWEIDEEGNKKYKAIKNRYFSIRYETRYGPVSFRIDDETTTTPGNYYIPFAIFEETGFKYFTNEYYRNFENNILRDAKKIKYRLRMPFSIFRNLDLQKRFYIEQSEFLINKMTYKGNKEVEVEAIKIN